MKIEQARQLSFGDGSKNATKPRHALKLFQNFNDKQIETTLVKQWNWHDPQPTTTRKVISLYLNRDRALKLVNGLSLRAINWNNTSGHADITVFFANLVCSFPVALLVRQRR